MPGLCTVLVQLLVSTDWFLLILMVTFEFEKKSRLLGCSSVIIKKVQCKNRASDTLQKKGYRKI